MVYILPHNLNYMYLDNLDYNLLLVHHNNVVALYPLDDYIQHLFLLMLVVVVVVNLLVAVVVVLVLVNQPIYKEYDNSLR